MLGTEPLLRSQITTELYSSTELYQRQLLFVFYRISMVNTHGYVSWWYKQTHASQHKWPAMIWLCRHEKRSNAIFNSEPHRHRLFSHSSFAGVSPIAAGVYGTQRCICSEHEASRNQRLANQGCRRIRKQRRSQPSMINSSHSFVQPRGQRNEGACEINVISQYNSPTIYKHQRLSNLCYWQRTFGKPARKCSKYYKPTRNRQSTWSHQHQPDVKPLQKVNLISNQRQHRHEHALQTTTTFTQTLSSHAVHTRSTHIEDAPVSPAI